MISFRNKSGFTLVEALIAVAVMAIVLTPIFVLYSTLLTTVIQSDHRFDRMLAAHNFLVASQRALRTGSKTTPEKKILRPPTTLTFKHDKVSSDTLAKVKNLYLDKVALEWQDGKTKRTDALVTFVYQASKQESKGQEGK